VATIVYLDADDEITSAAARIRSTDENRVALVVPYGSRLATSRINFRLLAREAQTRGRRLAIVAGDAATRALAASAGLPAFGSVGEYEGASAETPDGGDGPTSAARATAQAATGASAAAAAAIDAPAPQPDDLAATAVVATPVQAPRAGSAVPSGRAATPAGDLLSRSAGTVSIPVAKPRRTLPFGRTAAVVGVAVLAFVVLVAGVAGYLLLPSASIAVTAREERIGPVQLTIRADPAVTAVDASAGIVPAERLSFDLAASDSFPATGVRVETDPASGSVRFQSFDTGGSNEIPAGSIVSTEGGTQFRTAAAVTLPPAELVPASPGFNVIPSEASVAVAAVREGTAGNVPANSITVVPEGENPTLTKVTNPQATSGGRREEFTLVVQADVDAAVAALTSQLEAQFASILADPATVPAGKTLFPETATTTTPEPTVAPESLVGREVESFELGMTGSGSLIAVDESPLEEIARTRIRGRVEAGHRLVDDSIEVGAPEATVEGQVVTFTVRATAAQVRVLDAADLRALVRGKPVAEARTILAQFGEVELSVWPDWVTTIPTIDARLVLTVDTGPSPSFSPSSSPGTSGPPPGSLRPTGSPAAPSGSAPPTP
jgi:hypothetical protein